MPFFLPRLVLPLPRLPGPAPGDAHRARSGRTHRTSIVCGAGKGGRAVQGAASLGGLSGGSCSPRHHWGAQRGVWAVCTPRSRSLPAALKAGASETSSVPTVHYFGTPWDPFGWRWTRSCQGAPSPPEGGLPHLQTMQTRDEVQSNSRRFGKICSTQGFSRCSQG